MATTAGNLLQRTRCMYFRDTAMPCNKREPGSGCGAIGGVNRSLAVLGTSEHCIATNPSDMCVAMAALEATVHVQGPQGGAAIAVRASSICCPGDTPERETVLEPGDLITHVTLAAARGGRNKQLYLKLRDRASYEFALASAAVVVSTRAARSRGRASRSAASARNRGGLPRRRRRWSARPPATPPFRTAAEAALQGRQAAEPERLQGRARQALSRLRAATAAASA